MKVLIKVWFDDGDTAHWEVYVKPGISIRDKVEHMCAMMEKAGKKVYRWEIDGNQGVL